MATARVQARGQRGHLWTLRKSVAKLTVARSPDLEPPGFPAPAAPQPGERKGEAKGRVQGKKGQAKGN